MIGQMIVIPVKGEAKITDYNGSQPSYEDIKAGLDGATLEAIPFFDLFNATINDKAMSAYVPCVAYCDEEGKVKDLLQNPLATVLWAESLSLHNLPLIDRLHGPVVILVGDREFIEG